MVNNSTNINKTIESLDSDGQQFHQYQRNNIKFKQWGLTIAPISTKRTIIFILTSFNTHTKKTTTYDFGNPVPSLK
jgi:hypothetical protein